MEGPLVFRLAYIHRILEKIFLILNKETYFPMQIEDYRGYSQDDLSVYY